MFLLPVFSVNVSAASEENLISHNFNDWTILPEHKDSTFVFGNSGINDIQAFRTKVVYEVNGNNISVGGIYDISSQYNVGDEYVLSFEFISSDRFIGDSIGTIGSDKAFTDFSSTLVVGIGSYNNNSVNVDDEFRIVIDNSNYNDYVNGTVTFSFTMPSGLVNPCVAIAFLCYSESGSQNNNVYLTFRNFSLINKSAEKEEGFFTRLFEWFETKFKAIGDSFTDLKDSFVVKINDLKESFQMKIDELKQSFIDLKNDLIEGIKGLFVPDEAEISEWKLNLETLLSENLGFIYQVPDLVTNVVTQLRNILVRDDFSFSIKLPQLDFNLFGHDAVLWETQTVDFSYIFDEGIFKTFYSMYKVVLTVIFGFALVKYGWRVFEELMQN